MSLIVIPAFLRQRSVAGTGAVSMMTGSAPCIAMARTRARGLRPCERA